MPEATNALRAAFGAPVDRPELCATSGALAWLDGVAVAGRGRFAAARAVAATVRVGPYAPAARCLEASMLRQAGQHRAAATPDGRALAGAASPPPDAGQATSEVTTMLRVDALVGLAADALGVGRFALCARLLDRAQHDLHGCDALAEPPWWTVPRARLRHNWVAAELAVYSGDGPGAARALEVLIEQDPGPNRPRHHAKTQLIASAAAAASGRPAAAVQLATTGYAASVEHGMNPLQWAGAKLVTALTGAAPEPRQPQAADIEARWIRDGAQFGQL